MTCNTHGIPALTGEAAHSFVEEHGNGGRSKSCGSFKARPTLIARHT